jgi:hypothetical protein
LMEMDERPASSFNVHYSGWDRSGVVANASVGIHHPNGDEKAISFNDDPLLTVDNCIGPGTNTHWEVDDWDVGTTEVGSSGSGVWDAQTKRLVGFLSGGASSCSLAEADCYGKFSVAWDGPSAAQRLRDHLDPQNVGVVAVDGKDPEFEPVSNDDFANATRLNGRSGTASGNNIGATSQAGEPTHAGVGGGQSVWWKWRAPRTERVVFSTAGSNFDTVLAAYHGRSLSRLRELASNDDVGGIGVQSRVRLRVVAGRQYRIAVDGYPGNESEGEIVLNFRPVSARGSPDDAMASNRIQP